jgi:hypothetical protein
MQADELNGFASRFELKGFCRPEDLGDALDRRDRPVLVLCDIEGGELDVLDPAKVEHLSDVDMLVETHDAFVHDCTTTLIARFTPTHEIEQIVARQRSLADFPSSLIPELARLAPRIAVELMNERRTGTQKWLYLTARRSLDPKAP